LHCTGGDFLKCADTISQTLSATSCPTLLPSFVDDVVCTPKYTRATLTNSSYSVIVDQLIGISVAGAYPTVLGPVLGTSVTPATCPGFPTVIFLALY